MDRFVNWSECSDEPLSATEKIENENENDESDDAVILEDSRG